MMNPNGEYIFMKNAKQPQSERSITISRKPEEKTT